MPDQPMTPEERAAAVVRAMQDAFGVDPYLPCLRDCLGDGAEHVVRFIAAALRAHGDQVRAEERERGD